MTRSLLLLCWLAIPAGLACLTPAQGALELDHAYLAPDVIPGEVSETGQPEPQPGAALHLFVRNTTSQPVTIERILVDGTPVEALHEQRVVAWWRVQPAPVPGGGLAEVTVRLQTQEAPEVAVTLETAPPGEPLGAVVPASEPALRIANIAFAPDLAAIYLTAQRAAAPAAPIVEVFLDGVDVTPRAERPGCFRGLTPLRVGLDAPLERGSFHVLKVVNSEGEAAAAGARVWDSIFEIGTFGNFYPEQYAEAGFNTYQSFRGLEREALDRLQGVGLRLTAPYFRPRQAYFYDGLDLGAVRQALEAVKGHSGVLAYYLEDEPDVFDWQYCGCFDHWFELSLDGPRAISGVTVHELKGYLKECAVQGWLEGEWRTLASKRGEELGEYSGSDLGRTLEFRFDTVRTDKLRIRMPLASHMPGIRELEVWDEAGANLAAQGQPRASSRFLAFYGRTGDEPDKAIDGNPETHWRASHSRPAWVGATGMEMVQREALYRSVDPGALTMCLVNNTYTPGNWFTYAQVADLFDTDPYVSPSPGRECDYSPVYRKSRIACAASAPKPCFITLWMGWGADHCRCLTEAEERIMVYYALGAGARGINYYIHSSSAGDQSVMTAVHAFPAGPEREAAQAQADRLWQGVGRINRQLALVGPWLSCGVPVGAVEQAPEGLWARTILSANGALVLVVVNQRYTATGEAFSLEAIEPAQVKLALPEWLAAAPAQEVTSQGLVRLPSQIQGGLAQVSLGRVEDAKLVVIR